MNHRFYISEIKRFTNKVVFDCGYIPDPLKTGNNLADETIVHTTRQEIVFSTGMLNYYLVLCIIYIRL